MIGVFIEPESNLYDFIKKWKKNLLNDYNNTSYTKHPPHLSLYVADLKSEEKFLSKMNDVLCNFNQFEIFVNNIGLFENDLFTKKDTLYLNVKKNKNLTILQLKIAEIGKKYLSKKKMEDNNILSSNLLLKNSFKKFGFPFVGPHWIPHFTIASIQNFAYENKYKYLKKKKIKFISRVNIVSIWKINKDTHFKIKEIRLKNIK
tara:strand:+ start:667 stop:1275 length:609 start_codon:yes stop_codon:yes gene_type:complete